MPKVVAYVVHHDKLLVFTHDDVPVEVAGVQVPAGTIEPGEDPAYAVVREVREETGIETRVVGKLGVEQYDVWPSKAELHERHFFLLQPVSEVVPEQWTAGEDRPGDGGSRRSWTCCWIPLEQAHVLCAGFGAKLGALDRGGDRQIEVRPCRAAELPLLMEREVPGADIASRQFARQQDGEGVLLVAWLGSEPVGSGEVVFTDPPELRNLHVEPAHRGLGIGTALLDAAERMSVNRGALSVGVGPDNVDARRLYLRRGFVPTGRHETTTYRYRDADGVEREAIETDEILIKHLA
ncbi:GNAT family N-acetyltransferase [Microcella sp.]|uniref:GNAT family N-acetyltransferase n=1 Tax=Microcella sp. TaxID=1913979 RepID=UPI00391DF3A1